MNIVQRAATGNFRRNPLLMLGSFALLLFVADKAAEFIIAGNMIGLALVAVAFVGGSVIVAMLNDWRKGLYFFLTWLLFEDFARKYLGNNMAIYFVKDVLAAILYLSFFIAFRRKLVPSFHPPFLVPLLIFVWFGVMQVFNPASTNLLYGVLGLKLFFYYVPLLFVGYALIDSEEQLQKFLFVNIGLVIIIASLGIAQSILGQTFLNPENPAAAIRDLSTNYRISPLTGQVSYRPTSVFVSAGRYSDYLLVSLVLIVGFTGYLLLRNLRGRNLAFLGLTLAFGGIVLAGARGVLLWAIASVLVAAAAMVWGAPWKQGQVLRVVRAIQRSALGIALGVSLLFLFFPDALLSRVAFYTETLSPSSQSSELTFRAWDYPLENFLGAFGYDRWPYGYGIGTAGNGSQYVMSIFHATPIEARVESGFGAIVLEMGVGGLILWLVMGTAIVVSCWRVVKSLKGSPWFPIGFVIFWYAALLLFPMTFVGLQAYEDFVLNAYLWLLLGMLFRLPSLALSAQHAAAGLPQTCDRRIA